MLWHFSLHHLRKRWGESGREGEGERMRGIQEGVIKLRRLNAEPGKRKGEDKGKREINK